MMEKRRPKNFKDPIEVRKAFFGYETIHWWLTAVKAVELTETFVLTSYGSRNSKRANSYGRPKNHIHRVQHSLYKVQHSSKKPKRRRSTFRSGCRDLKWNSTMVNRSQGKSKTSNGDPVLT